jgi:hypothetical protein
MKFAPLCVLPMVALLAACGSEADPAEADPPTEVAETPVASATPRGPYAPRNDCGELPGAQAFLDEVNAAVAARDVDAFVNLADVHVLLTFGGGEGAAQLREELAADDGALWNETADLMAMGCAISKVNDAGQSGDESQFTTIILPWYLAQDTGGDPFETVIVTGEDVPVHHAASLTSPPLAYVSWEAVQLVPEPGETGINYSGDQETGWLRVRLPAGSGAGADPVEGYMQAENLRSVVDYRLLANNGDGRWKISALIAGD